MSPPTRKDYLRRAKTLETDRESYLSRWREIADHVQPHRAVFLTTDRNKSTPSPEILNPAPSKAVHVNAAGMLAAGSSPSRVWFRITTPDPALANRAAVRDWLWHVEETLRITFAKSNIYNELYNAYVDLAAFGSAAIHIDEDDEDVLRAYTYPIGQFSFATSARQKVDTVYRNLSMTVAQLVERFGIDAVSKRVRGHYEKRELDYWIDVLHVVEPNIDFDPSRAGPKGMRWRSVWLEKGGGDHDGFLKVSGFHEFPVLCPRWAVKGANAYGDSPGMDAIGACKLLQFYEKRKAQAFDKIVSPPMLVPSSILARNPTMRAGEIIPVDMVGAGMEPKPAYMIHPQATAEIRASITEAVQVIDEVFFASLWLSLLNSDRREMTATEAIERREEKLLQLGPTVGRMEDELWSPLIDRVFRLLLRAGRILPPPPELEGTDLKVEYTSILSQAQKLIGTSALERLVAFTGQAAQFDPTVVDKVDLDEAVDLYGDYLGAPPSVIRSEEKTQAIREQRVQAQQAQAQAEQMAQMAETARSLGQADMSGDNALTALNKSYGGAGGAR